MKKIILSLFICSTILFTGCMGDSKSGKFDPVTQVQSPHLTIPIGKDNTLPLGEVVNTDQLEKNIKTEIQSSSNSTQSQLTGLINTSVSKIGEKVVGLENNMDAMIKLTNNLDVKNTATLSAQAEMKNTLQNTLEATANIRAEMNNVLKITNTLETNLSMMNDIKTSVGNLDSKISGQAGLLNNMSSKVEDIKLNAGRDVNQLPREAVDLMMGNLKTYTIILGLLLVLGALAMVLLYRSNAQRETLRASSTKDELDKLYSLLLQVSPSLPKEFGEHLAKAMEHKP